jgi:integrase
MPRQTVGGLYKRCDCARRKWLKCDHPWHFDFYKGRKFRFSLDVIAKARGEQPPRSKGDAEALADRIRSEIRSGTFRDPNHPEPTPQPDPAALLTVGDVIDTYVTRHVKSPTRRESAQKTMLWHLGVLRRTEIPAAHGQHIRFEQKPIKDVTKADIEAIRDARRRAQIGAVAARDQWEREAAALTPGLTMDRPKPRLLPGAAGGETGINRLLERARHLFAWAIEEGYIDATPFKRGGQVVVRLTKESPRDRRLVESTDTRQPGEEERLLTSAGPHLRDLIIAGIATGCRVGELLALQWKDVRVTTGAKGQTRQSFVLPAGKTETNTAREVPVGARLAAVLDMRRHAPDGTSLGPEANVFGNEVGERIGSIKKAWQTAVLKAHGHTPQWVKGKKNQLAPESLAAYRAINLHFHDLRREFGSRVLESGSSLIEARDLLGHANISQTSTYLQSTAKALGLAIERKEEHERQLAEARQRAAEKNSQPDAERKNRLPSLSEVVESATVVKH